MKNLIVIVFLLILIKSQGYSQSFIWVKSESVPVSINPEYAQFPSEPDGQGNVLLGTLVNYKTNYSMKLYGDLSLKKFTDAGTLVMHRQFTGKAALDKIESDENGNIYLAGSFMDTLNIDSVNSIFNTGSGFSVNYFIIKLDNTGNFVWSKNINALYGNNFSLGTIKVKGTTLYAGILSFAVSMIKKFDSTGNELLSISQQPVRGISSLGIDSQGYIYASGAAQGGNINFGGLAATAPFIYNVYFVKYSPQGNGIWAKFVEDITFSFPKIVMGSDDNIYACGELFGSFMFGNLQAQGPQWVYDFFLTKIDSSGNFLWLREVPNTTGSPTGDARCGRADNITVDVQNNVYFTGFLRFTVNWGNNVTTVSSGSSDALILKYDTNGNIIWGRTAGGSSFDWGDEISSDISGNIYLSGNFAQSANFDTIFVSGSGNINAYLAKLSGNTVTTIGNTSAVTDYSLHQNYPNPFNPVTSIKFSIPRNGRISIKVFNAGGKLTEVLYNGMLNRGEYTVDFDGSRYSSGVYFYSMESTDYREARKMVLIK